VKEPEVSKCMRCRERIEFGQGHHVTAVWTNKNFCNTCWQQMEAERKAHKKAARAAATGGLLKPDAAAVLGSAVATAARGAARELELARVKIMDDNAQHRNSLQPVNCNNCGAPGQHRSQQCGFCHVEVA
jgi:hypothetical protein